VKTASRALRVWDLASGEKRVYSVASPGRGELASMGALVRPGRPPVRRNDPLEDLVLLVRDKSSSAGWTLDIGPFPGWKDVPTW
jgi:hypothetical protein